MAITIVMSKKNPPIDLGNSHKDFEGDSLSDFWKNGTKKQCLREEPQDQDLSVVSSSLNERDFFGKSAKDASSVEAGSRVATPVRHLAFDPLEGVWRFLSRPLVSRFALGGALLSVVGGTGLSVAAMQSYSFGVSEAKKVAEAANAIHALPVYTQNSKGDLSLVSSLESRPFVQDQVKVWNAESQAHPESNKSLYRQEDYISWNIIPVVPEDVRDGGPLYLTREALAVLEDNSLEAGTGFSLAGLMRPILSGGMGGGSTIPAQLCGDLWDQTGEYLPHSEIKNSGLRTAVSYKFAKTACGVGLATGGVMNVDEIVAHYLTYTYLGGANTHGALQFMSYYWGINDLKDPRLTDARKLILAALPKYPYTSEGDAKKNLERWKTIVERARKAAVALEGEGKITMVQKHAIDEAFLVEEGTPPTRALPNKDFEYVRELVAQEALAHVKDSGWFYSIDGLLVGMNEALEHSLPGIVRKGLATQSDRVRGTVLVTNAEGEYVGIYTGSKRGLLSNVEMKSGTQTAVNRLSVRLSPGSVGKLIVAAALAQKGFEPVEISRANDSGDALERATWDIIHSDKKLITDARELGVDDAFIKELIQCYGVWRPGVTASALEAAVKGNWEIAPKEMPALFYAFATGRALPEPHMITAELSAGAVKKLSVAPSVSARCAADLYQNGHSYPWGELPLYGTMSSIRRPSTLKPDGLIGKTGTVGVPGKSTQAVWAPLSAEFTDGERFMISNVAWAEKRDKRKNQPMYVIDMGFNMGANVQSTSVAVPISGEVLNSLAKHH